MIVQARRCDPVELAEAQHDTLLLGLDAVEAAGQPERHENQAYQHDALAAGRTASDTSAREQALNLLLAAA
jgi:hypothetical protein